MHHETPQQPSDPSSEIAPAPPALEPPSSDPNIRKLLRSLRSLRAASPAGEKTQRQVKPMSKQEAKLRELTAKLEWLKVVKTLSITRTYHGLLLRRHREEARNEASAAHSAVNTMIRVYKLSWKYARRRRAANVLRRYLSTSKVDKKWLLMAGRVRASAVKVQRWVRDCLVCR